MGARPEAGQQLVAGPMQRPVQRTAVSFLTVTEVAAITAEASR